jgi:hypothetical protein
MKYGVFDTQDNCWLGDDRGPKLFDVLIVARVSAQVTATQLGWSSTRLEGRAYDDSGNVLKDEVQTKMTPAQALRKIERGAL